MTVVGLMGAIGAGKSTVAGMLRDLGAPVFDADREAHEVLAELGRTDRKAIAEQVFRDPGALKALEAEVHPRVQARMEAWLKGRTGPAAVLDIPLLDEAGLALRCDALLFVDAPESLRAERLKASRGWAPEEARRRQALQGGIPAKRAKAHAVIENGGDLAATRRQVTEFWNRFVTPKGGSAR